MRYGVRLSNRLKVLTFIFATLFVLTACAGPQIVTVTPVQTDQSATAASTADSSAPVPTTPFDSTTIADPTPVPTATSTVTPTPTPVPTVASFEVDTRSGIAPISVQFTDTSSGPITSVHWDFGDGTTSTEPSPIHKFTKAGTHTVRLTVSGPNGTDNEVRSNYISVSPGEVVRLSISPDHPTVAVQETVDFEALGFDQYGNGVPIEVGWSLEADEGMLDDGLFTAGTTAQTLVGVVSAFLPTDPKLEPVSTSVTIAPGPLTQLTLSDVTRSLVVQETHQFNFIATDVFGNEIPDAVASWSVTSGAGSINGDGDFTAGSKSGDYEDGVQLTATYGGGSRSEAIELTINPGSIASIAIEPAIVRIERGSIQQFTAAGLDQFENKISNIDVTWSANGGLVSDSGAFSPGQFLGRYEVRAKQEGSVEKIEGVAIVDIVLPGLLGRWSAEGNAEDSVGNNNGRILGGVTYSPGVVGQGFNLNGVNGFVEIAEDGNLNLLGDVTVVLWASVGESLGTRIMVQKGDAGGSLDGPTAYEIGIDPNDRLYATFELEDGANVFLPGPQILDSDFHQFAYVRDATEKVHQLFVDGALVSEARYVGDPGDTSGDPVVFGTQRFAGEYFRGVIDELEIYNRALSIQEITELLVNVGTGSDLVLPTSE